MLFWKIWSMTNDIEKIRLKICNRGLTNTQLSTRVLELKYMGQRDEAKKLVDQNLIFDVFHFICNKETSIEQTKEMVKKIMSWYEKYYKILGSEVPDELKEMNVEKLLNDYKSMP